MRRRDFITLVGGGVAAWPRVAHTQQPTRMIGFLSSRSPGESTHIVAAFHQGLKAAGYIEGQWLRSDFDLNSHPTRQPASRQ
jgi:putative tryptophan/tyrosine transport system substrate-binding protein